MMYTLHIANILDSFLIYTKLFSFLSSIKKEESFKSPFIFSKDFGKKG